MHEYEPEWVEDLISGLSGYDGSLYREWLLNHPDEEETPSGTSAENRLSWHAYTPTTMVCAEIYNLLLARWTNGKADRLLQPGEQSERSKPRKQTIDLSQATAASMLAFLSNIR